MSILDQGCTCRRCLKASKEVLQKAREDWKNGKREIVFKPWDYECDDGCCYEYGTEIYVNGFMLNRDSDNTEYTIKDLMEFLEFEDVNIDYEFEDEVF